jgi:hypothetical protein
MSNICLPLRVGTTVVRTVIAGKATVFARTGPVSRTIIADRSGVAGAWTEIVEQKRERERDPETNTLGPRGKLASKNQGADGEQKNQRPFHFGANLEKYL